MPAGGQEQPFEIHGSGTIKNSCEACNDELLVKVAAPSFFRRCARLTSNFRQIPQSLAKHSTICRHCNCKSARPSFGHSSSISPCPKSTD